MNADDDHQAPKRSVAFHKLVSPSENAALREELYDVNPSFADTLIDNDVMVRVNDADDQINRPEYRRRLHAGSVEGLD